MVRRHSSVVFTLAFYTKDAGQIDRLFRSSGLMRNKWDERHGQQTYGEMTIAKALAAVTRQYKPRQRRQGGASAGRSHRPPPQPPTQPSLPAILIDDIQLSDLTCRAQAALTGANAPPSVFVRAGQLARVVRDENGRPAIEPYDRVRMRCRLSEVANFFTLRKVEGGYEQVGTNPPLSLAENVLALGRWDIAGLYQLTGKANSAAWSINVDGVVMNFAAGECLFLGASGSKRGADDWEISFRFAASPNATNLTVGDILGINKKGWEYLWVRYADSEDDAAKVLVKKPVAAYVEKVYEEGNFGGLGIGS